jgi:hypothetical protein
MQLALAALLFIEEYHNTYASIRTVIKLTTLKAGQSDFL